MFNLHEGVRRRERMKSRIVLASAAALLAAPAALAADWTTDGNGVGIIDNIYDGSLGSMQGISILVSGEGPSLADIDVILDFSHTWVGDLVFKIEAPTGAVVFLMSRPGYSEPADDGSGCCGTSSDAFLGTAYEIDDAAGTSSEAFAGGGPGVFHSSGFSESHGLSSLTGIDPNGTWTVYIGDGAGGDVGIYDGYTLQITSVPAPGAIALLGAAGLISRRRRRN